MILENKNIDDFFLDSLKNNHYSRRIKSHFRAYGTEYNFSRFFSIIKDKKCIGVISIFNASMMISSIDNFTFDSETLKEISVFILMNKPAVVEFEVEYSKQLAELLECEYKSEIRTEFEFVSKKILPPLEVQEVPKLDDVYNVLKTSFPAIANSYEMWLTDTSHRVRHGLSQSFLLGNYSTATIQYIIDKIALIGHVATIPEERGKFHARSLLYWIGERLTLDGFSVRLLARPNRVSYYEEIGFKEIARDIVLERK